MHNVSAHFRSHASVQLPRHEIPENGLTRGEVRVVPDPMFGMNPDPDATQLGLLHKIGRTMSDVRINTDRVRGGDFVSAAVETDGVDQVVAIMCRSDVFAEDARKQRRISDIRLIDHERHVAGSDPFGGRGATKIGGASLRHRGGRRTCA